MCILQVAFSKNPMCRVLVIKRDKPLSTYNSEVLHAYDLRFTSLQGGPNFFGQFWLNTILFWMNIFPICFQKPVTETYKFCVMQFVSSYITISEHSSITNDMFNPRATSLNHSSYTIEVCDNPVQHFTWNPPDFPTNFSLQCLYCLWIIAVYSFFQIYPKEVVWRG
jgi:hypothetical protein